MRLVSVVDHQLREVNSASIKSNNILEAEEVAIALAITHQGKESTAEIVTDSQEACRRYSSGRVSTAAIRILKARKITFSCAEFWNARTVELPADGEAVRTAEPES
ncbi:hypothetical protein HPB52_010334 [Rhipicephalus sanguineus]|uniref:Uncharacterized protein n=1 Tax=Rhipicephalus sanguineus TaxID=34632 RepID=A0A9D4SNS0_RHISA|nr:hypothetical protein HPB52_010334 [Rhipicephalus sanguineus]